MTEFVIDTNVVITFITAPLNEHEKQKFAAARALFNQIENGECSAILPEIVLHETFYTLLGPRFPDTNLTELCSVISGMLQWSGWNFRDGELAVYLRALEILQESPSLEFSDSAIVARAEIQDAYLATFDRHMAKVHTGRIWKGDS